MITGDNPLTAVSVARECGLISQIAHVFIPVFAEGLSFSDGLYICLTQTKQVTGKPENPNSSGLVWRTLIGN
jgi:magnesium-transporting ATPase (P-type)